MIPVKVRTMQAVESFLTKADLASGQGETPNAWTLLAKAHVISQPFAWLHVRVHWYMLRLALRTLDSKEVSGQLFRLVVAAPGSVLKRYPKGNPGTSDVSPFQPMPITQDVQTTIDQTKVEK